MQTNLVLQSFGREVEYRRAILTVLSYYAYTSLPFDQTRVVLFTDQPSYFSNYFSGLPVQCVLLTPEKIKEMRGSIDFLHRIKIAVIEEAFAITKGNLLYADSDTFFTSDPTPLEQQLTENKSFMHLLEYPFEEDISDKTETYQAFFNLINNKDFYLSNGSKLKVTRQHSSWNAGVMFFHKDHYRLLPDVYTLTDQFYPFSNSHASEQYAFSIVLQNNVDLAPCDKVIYHYWYRIKKQITDQFLNQKATEKWASLPLNQKLANVRSWCEMLPNYYVRHEWTKRDNAIQAFNNNQFLEGYRWAFRTLRMNLKGNRSFVKDILYHTKRLIIEKFK